MLEVAGVCKSYDSPGGPVNVLKDVSLSVDAGGSVAVVGPSGSGKSTLLNMIGGLDYPTSGQVLFDGVNIAELTEAELAAFRNRQIGFVFQLHHLLPQCTVLENVLIPTLAGKGSVKGRAAELRAGELLERVGLSQWAQHRPGELSGGQMQRVAVVRALINDPALLLADEPTGSLDKAASDNVAELLIELNVSEKVSLIVVTHSEKLAGRMAKVYELNDGVLSEGLSR